MSASSTLSLEQKRCLESVYTFTNSATLYLRAVENIVCPEDEAVLNSLVKWGELCLSRLPECFAELQPLAVERERRGGVS